LYALVVTVERVLKTLLAKLIFLGNEGAGAIDFFGDLRTGVIVLLFKPEDPIVVDRRMWKFEPRATEGREKWASPRWFADHDLLVESATILP
jgi:hypothetical protein